MGPRAPNVGTQPLAHLPVPLEPVVIIENLEDQTRPPIGNLSRL